MNLENEELKQFSKDEIIFNVKINSKSNAFAKWNWNGLPCPTKEYEETPLTLLVQNPFMNRNYSWMSFKHVDFNLADINYSSIFSFKLNNQMIGCNKNIKAK